MPRTLSPPLFVLPFPKAAAGACHGPVARSSTASGFSLVEILLSVALLGIVLSGLVVSWRISSGAQQNSRAQNLRESVVDADLAVMEDLAFRYTCCPGSCTVDPALIAASATCKGVGGASTPQPGTEYYYFPYYAPAAASLPNVEAFAGRTDQSPRDAVFEDGSCHTGALLDNLVTALTQADRSALDDAGVTRTVAIESAMQHRLRLSYAGPAPIRMVLLVPAVAAWCP